MALDPFAIMTVGGILWKVVTDLPKKRRPGLAEPPAFSAVDVETFTSVELSPASAGMLHPTKTRRFDADMCRAIAKVLRSRSARQVHVPELAQEYGHLQLAVYEIVPPAMGLPVASDVIEHAAAHGLVCLGSLSLSQLLTGSPMPFTIVVGPAGTEQLAVAGTNPQTGEPAAQFARIHSPVPPTVVETTATPVVEAVAEPVAEAAPVEPAKANGAHVPAKTPAVVDVAAEAKDG